MFAGSIARSAKRRYLRQRCTLKTLVLVSRRLEDMKNGLGLGLLKEGVRTIDRPDYLPQEISPENYSPVIS